MPTTEQLNAAAPALLDACRALMEALHDIKGMDLPESMFIAIGKAAKAIAKADPEGVVMMARNP